MCTAIPDATIIHHADEGKELMVEKCGLKNADKNKCPFRVNVNYGQSVETILELVDLADRCEQSITVMSRHVFGIFGRIALFRSQCLNFN